MTRIAGRQLARERHLPVYSIRPETITQPTPELTEMQTGLTNYNLELYSKPQLSEKKNNPRAASYASR
jgi:hypothetical protein